jgi:hypothetical protein
MEEFVKPPEIPQQVWDELDRLRVFQEALTGAGFFIRPAQTEQPKKSAGTVTEVHAE